MNGRQSTVAVVALLVYSAAIFSLGQRVENYASQDKEKGAKAMMTGAGGGCGGGEAAGGCGAAHGASVPAVVKAIEPGQAKLSDKSKPALEKALKAHKAAVEKANAQLAVSLAKLEKLDAKGKSDMECLLNRTTGVHAEGSSCGAGGAGGGCGMGAGLGPMMKDNAKPMMSKPKVTAQKT